jgi:hypothetical protein
MIVIGSMRHSPSGRKRKTNAWKKTVVKASKSVLQTSAKTIQESKKFTVAPAYNKGAYQVIPRSDIKHIGK